MASFHPPAVIGCGDIHPAYMEITTNGSSVPVRGVTLAAAMLFMSLTLIASSGRGSTTLKTGLNHSTATRSESFAIRGHLRRLK